MSKIFIIHEPASGQSWQRQWLAYKNCVEDLESEGIRLDIGTEEHVTDGYDVYIVNRQPNEELIKFLDGKKFVWHIDDDLWSIPEWNPAFKSFSAERCGWALENAADIWVSTEPLRAVAGRGWVLPNLLDVDYWPPYERKENEKLRLAWAGSCFHEPDIEMVAQTFERLLNRYDNIFCVFFGCHPESMGRWVRVPASNTAILFPHERYENRLGFALPVAIERYPKALQELNADIALAALEDSTFARSKSNLKWLEYGMTGAATVASPLPPYNETVSLRNDLYEDCCELIEDGEKRVALGAEAREAVRGHWTWGCYKKELWMQAFRAAVA